MTSVWSFFYDAPLPFTTLGLRFWTAARLGGLILGISGHQHPRSGSRPNGAAFPARSRGIRCWDQRLYLVTASAE